MTSQQEHDIVDALSKFLLDTMMFSNPPQIPERFASVESLQALHAYLLALRDFLNAASNGDLSRQVLCKGYLAGTLKTLQANLRHITWQTKMIAAGDFTHRIEFMGEFSRSFNAMVTQLDQTLKELVRKETKLSQANDELLNEISVRKQTEAALLDREETLRRLAIMDSLTGLYNRGHFNKTADAEISRAMRYALPLSVIMFDIDFFKRINDTFGHTAGDMVLQMVANTTKQMVRANDLAARYGGEEFVILLPETQMKEAVAVAERLRKRIEDTVVEKDETPIRVTASFGVSDYRGGEDVKSREKSLSEFVNNADQALYVSKNAGRNRVTVYEQEVPLQ